MKALPLGGPALGAQLNPPISSLWPMAHGSRPNNAGGQVYNEGIHVYLMFFANLNKSTKHSPSKA